MRNNRTREIVLSGLFLALGVLVPVAFHAVGTAGSVFLPMHIPVLVAGFILSPAFAFMVGVLTPILSSIFTGMPVFMPMAFIMAVELGTYGLTVALLKKNGISDIISLVISMITGRIAGGLMVAFMVSAIGIKFAPPLAYISGAIITGLPGIIIQLIFIPALLFVVRKSSLSIGK